MTNKMTNKDYLLDIFRKAHEDKASYVGVSVMMEGFEEVEFIINPYENILGKLEYYLKTYDEDLNHYYSNGIKIVAIWTMRDDLWTIELDTSVR